MTLDDDRRTGARIRQRAHAWAPRMGVAELEPAEVAQRGDPGECKVLDILQRGQLHPLDYRRMCDQPDARFIRVQPKAERERGALRGRGVEQLERVRLPAGDQLTDRVGALDRAYLAVTPSVRDV